MGDITPFLTICGMLCIWPMVIGLIGFYIGRRGFPFRIIRVAPRHQGRNAERFAHPHG